MKGYSFLYITPEIVLCLGGIVLMLLSGFKRIKIEVFAFVTMAFLIVSAVFQLFDLSGVYSYKLYPEIFHKMFIVDTFSSYFSLLFVLGAIFTMLVGKHYFERREYFRGEFFALLLFAVFGMSMLMHSNELITLFISLEIASLSIYVMTGFNRANNRRVEAAYKYMILGAFAGAFYLLGVALLYAQTGTTLLGDIGAYLSAHQTDSLLVAYVGGISLIILIFFKISAFPFHSWTLDVYGGAPLPVSGFMAATFKIAIFGFLIRLLVVDFDSISYIWHNLFYWVTILTIAFGTFLATAQTNIKRLLASSSIVHTGYMMIAVSSIQEVGVAATTSIIFYLVAYFLSAIGSFGLLSYITSDERVRVTYDDFKGFGKSHPYMAAMMTIFMFSLAGIPGTIGFMGKFYIFTTAIEAHNYMLAIVGVLATFISIYYYFKLIAVMYFYKDPVLRVGPKLKGISPKVLAFTALLILWGGMGNSHILFIPGVDFLIKLAHMSYESMLLPFQ
jgi:NADH-quinone oxidoreductase subunit N